MEQLKSHTRVGLAQTSAFISDIHMLSLSCVNELPIDLDHGQDSSYKAWPDTKTKYTNGKSDRAKLVSRSIARVSVIHQSITERRHFGNFNFCKVLYGERAKLARSVIYHKEPGKNYHFHMDQFHNHAQQLNVAKNCGGPLDNQTWYTNG